MRAGSKSSRLAAGLLYLGLCALGPWQLASGLEAREKEEGKKAAANPPRKAPAGKEASSGKKEKPPPKRVPLPRAGEHKPEDILALAGLLTGRVVRIEDERVRQTPILISEEMAEAKVNLDELALLLAAHRLFLFPVDDPKEGKILVVSRNPEWQKQPPRFTRIIEVKQGDFDAVWSKVERVVKEKNAALPPGEVPIVAVSSARTGKIILGAASEKLLEEVSELAQVRDEKGKTRPRLYTYQGRFRRVEDLEEELLEDLSEGERNLLRVVVSGQGNRLLYRCPEKLGEKVRSLLEKHDKAAAAR